MLSWLLFWGSSANAQTLNAQTQENQKRLFEVVAESDSIQSVDSIPQVVDSIPTAVSDSTLTVPSDSTSKEKEIWFFDAVQELKKKNDSKNMNKGKPWIEPDPDDDKVPWTSPEDWKKEIKEKAESSASFSRQSWVWYSVNGWNTLWVNRFIWSGNLFKGKLWEISVLWIADLDDPLNSKWSWKLLLWKKLHKWLSLDWDYTFSGTWNNVFRFGLWYGGKLWDGSYGVKIFPLNTNGSPIAAKVSLSTKVWENWYLSSFVSVDFDTMGYYWEAEYTHQLAKWVAAFVQARLMWTMDGKFTSTDRQIFMWWVKFNL